MFYWLQVKEEIRLMKENIDHLQHAIDEKQRPMQVAHTRLDTRTYRPNIEMCRDRVQHKLVSEVVYHHIIVPYFCRNVPY